jgi:hypothetical protein
VIAVIALIALFVSQSLPVEQPAAARPDERRTRVAAGAG